jgi:hypothetical protein
MPTKKQRRRAEKERRHEYETVWVDAEGNELEEPPEEPVASPRPKRDDGKPKAKQPQQQQQRGGRSVRVPPPPSWQRAGRRSLILGAVVFALFYVVGSKGGKRDPFTAIEISVIYTLLFIPFTYYMDRWTYNRWQRRAEQQSGKRPARKR